MEYNIKNENRKKFQDKSRLKRHHKKDYSKVVRVKPEGEERHESSDSEDELDEEGNIIDKLDEEGNVIPRKKKLQGNEWRYKEELHIEGLDDDDEQIKQIDFKKLSLKEIDLGARKKTIDQMSNDELLTLRFHDPKHEQRSHTPNVNKKNAKDNQLALPVRKPVETVKPASFTPGHLKDDEAFLDDLL